RPRRGEECEAIEVPLHRRRDERLLRAVGGADLVHPDRAVAEVDLRVDAGLADAAQALRHAEVDAAAREFHRPAMVPWRSPTPTAPRALRARPNRARMRAWI